jgi:REP element-mobilizing transposase RayT
MTTYRRNFVAGGTYFFTVNLADRRRPLLTENIECLRAAFRYTRHRYPFTIDAIVVLPDHLHTIWTMPEGDSDFAVRWNLIKGNFSRGYRELRMFQIAACGKVNAEFGSAAIGSTPFGTRTISHGTSTTFTSIRSSTAMLSTRALGPIRHSIEWCGSGSTPRIGPEIPRTRKAGLASYNGITRTGFVDS